MKKLLALSVLLTLVSCGPQSKTKVIPAPQPESDVSIFNSWVPVGTGLHGLEVLDFSGGIIGGQSDIGLEQLCNGRYGNSGQVNGSNPSRALFMGDETQGTIQLGHTEYVGASEPACRGMSKEKYRYEIQGRTMILFMVNYPFSAQYEVLGL